MWFNQVLSIWKRAAAAMPLLFLFSCAMPRVIEQTQRDSLYVEYRERIVHDTVMYEPPQESTYIQTKDTTSHLETSLAESDASIVDGVLYHSLRNKPQKIPVPVVVTVHDTTVVQGSVRTEIVEVPAKLTKAQERWIRLGKWATGILSLLVAAAIAGIVIKFAK